MPHLKNQRGATNATQHFPQSPPHAIINIAIRSHQNSNMNVLLIATYEQGHQPFGLASPAAWLRAANAKVACLDISRDPLNESAIREADLIAIHVPMHTATRLAIELIASNPRNQSPRPSLLLRPLRPGERSLSPQARRANHPRRRIRSRPRILGKSPCQRHQTITPHPQSEPLISLARQNFQIPDRQDLPPLDRYATLRLPDGTSRIAGYTESSRGCKHLCRHCPIVPVYNGAFRIVPKEIVLEDIRRQIKSGAQHITFGDPRFLQRRRPRHPANRIAPPGIPAPNLRRHHQNRASPQTRKPNRQAPRHQLPLHNQRRRIHRRRCPRETSQKSHPRRFRTRAPRLPRPHSPAPTDLRPVLPMDHSRFLQRSPGFPRSQRSDRKCSPHPISHPSPNPSRLAPLRSTGYPKSSRPLRRKSPGPSVATSRTPTSINSANKSSKSSTPAKN